MNGITNLGSETPSHDQIDQDSMRTSGNNAAYQEYYDEEAEEEEENEPLDNDDAYEAIRVLKLKNSGKNGPIMAISPNTSGLVAQQHPPRSESGFGQLDISLPYIKGNQ